MIFLIPKKLESMDNDKDIDEDTESDDSFSDTSSSTSDDDRIPASVLPGFLQFSFFFFCTNSLKFCIMQYLTELLCLICFSRLSGQGKKE